jgi:hypothetical protein
MMQRCSVCSYVVRSLRSGRSISSAEAKSGRSFPSSRHTTRSRCLPVQVNTNTTLTHLRTTQQENYQVGAHFSSGPQFPSTIAADKGTVRERLDRLADRARLDSSTMSTTWTRDLNKVVAHWQSNPNKSELTPAQMLETLDSHAPPSSSRHTNLQYDCRYSH